MSGTSLTDTQIDQVLNKLNGQNCYISADSNEKGVASDVSPSTTFISNIIILVLVSFTFVGLKLGFKPFYETFLFNGVADAEKINTMNFVWWIISAFIIFFSLVIGILKNASHLIFWVFYAIAFFISLNAIFDTLDKKKLNPMKIFDASFFGNNASLFIIISFLVPTIFWILALSLKSAKTANILGFLGYFVAIISGLIATKLVK